MISEDLFDKCGEYLEEYLEVKSIAQITKKYKISQSTFREFLVLSGVEINNYQNQLRVNPNVFDNIDTEEKAYWLGFMYADGNVGTNLTSVELSLSDKDTVHLNKFGKFIEYSGTINRRNVEFKGKTYKAVRIMFRSKHMKEQLITLGCIPNKSLVLKFPTVYQVSDNLLRHFIRGYFDGDGCIYLIKRAKTDYFPSLSLLGTREFLDILQQRAPWFKGSITKAKQHLNNTFTLSCANNKYVYDMLDTLYKDTNIYLDRKYERYIKATTCRVN